MQLKSLEIYGFKSFGDRTKFIFDEGITGVVGPNGCGKSNVVDSIRWVLGEQKTRNLRSEKMENVIFNGTSRRKRANFAEVSLTFENTKNILPTEYTTVSITRKLYRSGESEYYLNGIQCRLKDIQNLFMDTGVSSDSYAIIELKMVEEILNDKENSRRNLFEEAAGISKYKIRKKQTLKKLSDTESDLDRVEDVLYEIKKQLKSLENQAKKAKKYLELKAEYKVVSSRHAWFKIRDLRMKYEQISTEEKKLDDESGGMQSEIAKFEARIQELKLRQVDNEKLLSSAQKSLNEHIRKIQEIEKEKSVKNERLKYLQQRQISINNQLEEDRKTLEKTASLIEELELKQRDAKISLQEKEKTYQEIADETEKAKDEFDIHSEETAGLEEEVNEEADAFRKIQKEIEIRQIQAESLESELMRTREDASSRTEELDSFADRLEILRSETAALDQTHTRLKQARLRHEEALEQLKESISNLKDTIYKISRGLDARRNEYDLTKSLVENLEGFPESVKFLKKEAEWIRKAPLVSDIFSTPEEYKVAFENLLEPYLSYYVVQDRTDALAAIRLLRDSSKGRANFFILNELKDYQPHAEADIPGAKAALSLIETADEHRQLAAFLLDKVYVYPEDSEMPDDIPAGVVFISSGGNVSHKQFVLSGGSVGLFQGKRLGRAKNLEKLEKEIRKLEKDLNKEKGNLEKMEKQLASLKQENPGEKIDEVGKELQGKQQELSILETREKEYREFLAVAGKRREELVEKISTLKSEVEEMKPEAVRLEESLTQKRALLEERRLMREGASAHYNSLRESSNEANIARIQAKNLFENIEKDLGLRKETVAKLRDNESTLKAQLKETREAIDDLVENNLKNDDEIIGLYEEKKEKEAEVEKYEEIAGQVRNSLDQVDENIRAKRKDKESMEERRTEIREQVTDIKIQLNALKERMQVEFQVDISDLDEEALFDGKPENHEPVGVEEEMHKIRQKIQNFGEINPMAVEAYDEMKERHDFIEEQKQDLIDAKQTLIDTISEIDETATKQFLEAFNLIRDNFKKVFQSLFYEGDTCDLLLTDPQNPLESSIDIMARPKGKRPLHINQLSGGEKTLTATSLLFAIYLLKPAPFCIFDEVDAPLDDANIDKFNNIIRDFSKDSQFIIVTHNKRTMASTNVMYGVTMEETGVSKVLPVDLVALNLN